MSEENSELTPIWPSRIRNGDFVVRAADLEAHPDVTKEDLLGKLGELGLPVSVVKRLKTGKDAVPLLHYDAETQPPLEACSWNELMDYLSADDLTRQHRSMAVSALEQLHNYGRGRDGGYYSSERNPRLPVFFYGSTGEPFDKMYIWRDADLSDITVDVAALDQYLRHGDVTYFGGVGEGTEALLTGFVNSRIEKLPGA
jgi:hypothetical protein